MIAIERVGSVRSALGEGPVWDAPTKRLYWVDSLHGIIYRREPDGSIHQWLLSDKIGSLAICGDEQAILALQSGIALYDFATRQLTPVNDPEATLPETRFNDGKTDRAGNFVTGTMGIKIRDRALSSLYRVRMDLSIERLCDDVIVTNGPCFSPDGGTFYFNDGRRRMLAFDYDPDGPLTNRRVFFDGATHNTGSDGATVDRDGNIWTALTGSSEVGSVSPSGKLLERIKMPIKLPSSVMFGGEHLDVLYVTSISDSGNRTSTEEGAGGLYRITGLGAVGIPEPRFRCLPPR